MPIDVDNFIKKNKINTIKVGGVDLDGVWRGKQITADHFVKTVAISGTHISNILFGWDIGDNLVPDLGYTGWHTGYPDFCLKPDLSTLAVVPWEDGTASVICDMFEEDGSPVPLSPRQLLATAVKQAKEMGFSAVASYEYEFFILQQSPDDLASTQWRDPKPLTTSGHTYSMLQHAGSEGVIGKIRSFLGAYGIDVEATNGEHGPGQFEINTRYSDPLRAADIAMMVKHAIKEISARYGHLASFMAKIKPEWAGSSGHVHQSLRDHTNAFVFANAETPSALSATGYSYLAGLVALAPEMSAIYLPTINSYRRTTGGSWAGANATWGYDNRTVAVRAIPSAAGSARIENRIPGADTNPYLVIASNLLSGMYGIKHGLTPTDAVVGNGYEVGPEKADRLPRSLSEAIELFDRSARVRSLFGDKFVDHFAAMKRWEIRQSDIHVTDWELARYLEKI